MAVVLRTFLGLNVKMVLVKPERISSAVPVKEIGDTQR